MTHIIHDIIADLLSPHRLVRQNGIAPDSDSIVIWPERAAAAKLFGTRMKEIRIQN